MSSSLDDILTLGPAAKAVGIEPWQLARLFDRGLLPRPHKIGPMRILRAEDLPQVIEAARRGGYLPPG